ncbi:ABC transporter permease [Bacillus massilinigeriensis]|uniref:ABC transporter permease n=1 Tax=Bacillus massilionigeriensis TaxID=1805475 RepID=UPI00096AE937|nr:ABC transporter permease [Bacillus massilionigeriensis]
MLQILASDFLKMRRKWIIFLIILGPVGVIGLEAVNFFLRYDYLTKQYEKDLWGGLIDNVRYLAVPTLIIGLTIITSMIANIEHQTNAWKQVLALPISKIKVFMGKFALSAILLLISSTLLAIGTVILGLILRFPTDIPYILLIKMMYYPYFAALTFIALQIWLSITIKNQAIPLTVGILGTVVSLGAGGFPDWVPYKWPTLINQWEEPIYSAMTGVLVGLLIILLGAIDFVRKDVK